LALSTTHFYQTEMRYYCHRLKVCELPIIFHGSSTSLKAREVLRSLCALLELRRRKPLKAETY
jgi:dolichol-phosphate mannosyltransferase